MNGAWPSFVFWYTRLGMYTTVQLVSCMNRVGRELHSMLEKMLVSGAGMVEEWYG